MIKQHTSHAADQGATAVEYGLILGAIAAVIVAVVFGLGTLTKGNFSSTSSCIAAGAAATC
jgi:pilus assembly protein Flp/PilA